MPRLLSHRHLLVLLALLLSWGVASGAAAVPAQSTEPGTLQGRVTGPDGRGLKRVWVSVALRTDSGWEFPDQGIYTDDSGRWSLSVTPGRHAVQVEDWTGDHVSVHYGSDDDYDRQDATLVQVGAGRVVSGLDVQLRPAARIQGRVTGETGSGIAGVQVTAYRWLDGPEGWKGAPAGPAWRAVMNGYSGGDSVYDVGGLPPGTYRLRFERQGYLTEWYDGQRGAARVEGARDVVVARAQVVGVDAMLTRGSSIAGTISVPAQAPELSGYVNVLGFQDDRWEQVANAWVGEDHRYVVAGLRAGTYKVAFGDLTRNHPTRYYPDFARVEDGQTIVVPDQDTELTGIDFDLGAPLRTPTDPQPPVTTTTPPHTKPVVSFNRDARLRGTLRVGQRLRIRTGKVSPSTATVRYRWFANRKRIARASGPTLQLRRVHVGRRISVRVIANAPGHTRTRIDLSRPARVRR